ncbi:hypothetical protein [Leptospira vanthielii]|uniref:hypothetical protein n=1 Tax=Leptospira vanthielii TaxID=293085 RepID=UPI0005870DB8|nr:hypothetical protein [Leptospira vanthielii]
MKQQYREWGEYKYLGNLGSSPIRSLLKLKDLESENDADKRAGTFGYGAGDKKVDKMILSSGINFSSDINIDKYRESLLQIYIIRKIGYVQ